MSHDPKQIAERRHAQRIDMHVEQRRILALELIADTLEAIRLDIADAVGMRESDAHTARHG